MIRARVAGAGSCPSTLVLVVDDDPDLLDVTRIALASAGFDVETAENGAQALSFLHAGHRPVLVLLDLMMPLMNGWEFLDALAKEPSLKEIPVVVLTAAQRVELPAGAMALLRKPIGLPSLVDAIERHRIRADHERG